MSAKWFWHTRLVIWACQVGGSGESSRWLRRARQVVQTGLAGVFRLFGVWFQHLMHMVLARLRCGSGRPDRCFHSVRQVVLA
ncbi:Uncharacterised protein [Mycobacteroides abscessus subsp. abscessus]|nr:Uncharacterised protein [Mycobacteroides abscessus subsp. abscessus]